MNEPFDAVPIKQSGQINFRCTLCGDCCRNLENAVMLESLDAYRLLQYLKKSGSPITGMDELYDRYTEPIPLNEQGYPICVLKTRGPQHECIFLKNNRCSVYEARPRTCRLYPFSAGPDDRGKAFQYYVCREKPHHFTGGVVHVHDWMHRNFDQESREFTLAEYQNAVKLGLLMRKLSGNCQQDVVFSLLYYLYWNYSPDKPFMPQYHNNHEILFKKLRELGRENGAYPPQQRINPEF